MKKVPDIEMIAKGDVLGFKIADRIAIVPLLHTVGVLTVGEFKKLCGEEIEVFRYKTIKVG